LFNQSNGHKLKILDHDLDYPGLDPGRLSIYGARGLLIESKGPVWGYSISNEHSVFYQWQLSGAQNIVLAQIQSETAYFQAGPMTALDPFAGGQFADDPTFQLCDAVGPKSSSVDSCREGSALRIINSTDVAIFGAGLYSFFQNYSDHCAQYGRSCQDRLLETSYSEGIYLYSLYTVGTSEVVSPEGDGYVIGRAGVILTWQSQIRRFEWPACWIRNLAVSLQRAGQRHEAPRRHSEDQKDALQGPQRPVDVYAGRRATRCVQGRPGRAKVCLHN
jgi:hypothetical protein